MLSKKHFTHKKFKVLLWHTSVKIAIIFYALYFLPQLHKNYSEYNFLLTFFNINN